MKEENKKEYRQYTIRFLKRAILFLAFSEFFLIAFYFFSNFQDFLDSGLLLILNVIIPVCVLLSIFTLASIIIKIVYAIKQKKLNGKAYFLADIILLIFSVVFAILFSFLLVLAKGN